MWQQFLLLLGLLLGLGNTVLILYFLVRMWGSGWVLNCLFPFGEGLYEVGLVSGEVLLLLVVIALLWRQIWKRM